MDKQYLKSYMDLVIKVHKVTLGFEFAESDRSKNTENLILYLRVI